MIETKVLESIINMEKAFSPFAITILVIWTLFWICNKWRDKGIGYFQSDMAIMNYYYKHDKENKKIIFNKPIKKGRNAVKIYFYRNIDEREATDFPVAIADGNGSCEYDWLDGFEILGINIKEPLLFGLLGYRGRVANNLSTS